jgi:tripartite-type tricarboxylate transporter receptor subunit TctC
LVYGTLASITTAALAQDFYRGKTVQLIIPSSTGGSYDFYGRIVSHILEKHIPGNPIVRPVNMTGAGGITAANYLYNVAPKDGTVIGLVANTVPFEPLLDNKAAKFDPAKFGWLGTPTTEIALYITYHTSTVRTLADTQKIPVTTGSLGPASTQAFYARVFNELLNMKVKIVNGYPTQNDIFLAMERGEVDANSAPFWSSMKAVRPDWYPKKLANFLFQYGPRPHPELPDVLFAPSLMTNEADKQLLNTALAPLALGRPFVAPPDVPSERLAILKKAFMEAMRDPEFLSDCAKQHLECDDARDGSELAAQINQAYSTPSDIRNRLVSIYSDTAGK